MNAFRHKGFTLIELMITVAVIGILAAVALPSYNDYIRRSTIQEAFATLADLRVKLEQFYQNNRGYGTTGQATPCGHDGTASQVNVAATNGKFTFVCALGANNQSYTITATGATGVAVGHTYTIDNTNVRGTTAFKGSAVTKNCWLVKGSEC